MERTESRIASALGERPTQSDGSVGPSDTLAEVNEITGNGARPGARGRVLLVAPQPFFELRGTPLNVLHMVQTLCDARYEVHLVTYGLGSDVKVPGLIHHRALHPPWVRSVPIGFSRRKVLLDMLMAPLVWRLLFTRRFDLVHAVEEAVFFALPAARLRRLPLIYDLDSSLSHQLEYAGVIRNPWLLRQVRMLEGAALRRSTLAITVCRWLSERAREAAPALPVAQIEDFPLDEALCPADPERVRQLRTHLGLDGCRIAVYTGNLEPYQGVDLLLDAWKQVAPAQPNARLVIVGGESKQIGAARNSLAGTAAADRVLFLGKRPSDQMAEFMGLADVLVSPRSEGFNTPLKIYTYMSSGVPIVATDRLTHTQVLDDECAVLCPPTAEGMASALARVLAAPEAFAPRALSARSRVHTRYSRRSFETKLLAAYESVLKRGTPVGSHRTPEG